MWLFTWQFLIGLWVGFIFGVFVMGRLAWASRAEREVQKEVGI